MTTYILSKFKAHLPLIEDALNGVKDLRYNQKIYKKIYKYYKEQGVNFCGDSASDYETILDLLYEDVS